MKQKNGLKMYNNGQLEIDLRVEDAACSKFIDFNFKHTQHSFLRAAQRGINQKKMNGNTNNYDCFSHKISSIVFDLLHKTTI